MLQTMEIAVCDQHVLYMEEVYDSHQNEAPLIAVLLSDRLLLTQKTEGHLVVVQQPIYLCDILNFNFDLSHGRLNFDLAHDRLYSKLRHAHEY